MLIRLTNDCIVNSDAIVSVERATSPVEFKCEVRVALQGRMEPVVLTGTAAENAWYWWAVAANDYRLPFPDKVKERRGLD